MMNHGRPRTRWLDASWMTGTGKSQHWRWRKLRDSATSDHGLFPPSRVMLHLMRADDGRKAAAWDPKRQAILGNLKALR
jgi:hypothetical protein